MVVKAWSTGGQSLAVHEHNGGALRLKALMHARVSCRATMPDDAEKIGLVRTKDTPAVHWPTNVQPAMSSGRSALDGSSPVEGQSTCPDSRFSSAEVSE